MITAALGIDPSGTQSSTQTSTSTSVPSLLDWANGATTSPRPQQVTPAPATTSSVPSLLEWSGIAQPTTSQQQPQQPQQPAAFATDNVDTDRGMRVIEWVIEHQAVPLGDDDQQLRDMVGTMARLYFGGDEETKSSVEEVMIAVSDVVPKEMWAQYGLEKFTDTESGFDNFGGRFLDNAKGLGGTITNWGFGDNPFGKYVGQPLATGLSHMQQTALMTVSAVRNGRIGDAAMILAEAVAEPATLGKIDTDGGAVDRELARWDIDSNGWMDFAEALGYNPNSSGRGGWVGGFIFELANFVGGELLDPLNYLTLGGASAKGGLDMVEEMYGTGARLVVEREGLDAVLSASEQAALQSRLTKSLEIAFGEEGRRRTAYEVLRRLDPSDVADKRVREAISSIQSGRGVHVAGVRLPGSEAVQQFPGRQKVEYAGRADEIARRKLLTPDPTDIRPIDQQFGKRINILDGTYIDGDDLRALVDSPTELTPAAETAAAARYEFGVTTHSGDPMGTGRFTLYDDGTAIIDDVTPSDPAGSLVDVNSRLLDDVIPTLENSGFHTIRVRADGDPWSWTDKGFVLDTARTSEVMEWLDHLDARLGQILSDEGTASAAGKALGGGSDRFGYYAAVRDLRERVLAARDNPNAANLFAIADPTGPNWKAIGELIDGDWGVVPMMRGITNVPGNGHIARIVSPGLAQRIRQSPTGQFFGDRLTPRAGVRRTSGTQTAEGLYRSQQRAKFAAENQLDDNIGAMTKLKRQAQAEFADDPTVVDDIVREALEKTDEPGNIYGPVGDPLDGTAVLAKLDHEDLLTAELQALRSEGKFATAEYLELMHDLRKAGDDAAVKAGLPEDFLREGYFPRITTQEGEKAIKENAHLMEKFGLDPNSKVSLHEQMHQKRRTFMPEATIEEANDAARIMFDLEDGVNLFVEDPLVAFALRSKSSFTAAAQMDMLDELVGLTDDTGRTVAAWGEGAVGYNEKALRQLQLRRSEAGFRTVKVDTPRGPLYTTPEIAKEIDNIRKVMFNDETLEHFQAFLDRWSQIWGTYATVPLADGFGFHMRNAYGNVMLNLTAGVTSPAVYWHAARLQNASGKARRRLGAVSGTGDRNAVFAGMSFDDIVKSDHLGLSSRDQALLIGARDRGIIGNGFFQDLAPDELDNVYRAIPKGKVGKGLQTTTDKAIDNRVVRTGRAVGTSVENNARLAHYIDRINKGFSAEEAAASVRRYLFDYGDLTPFERARLRSISRFYTFMRKNTALQTWAIMHNPAGVARQLRAHRSLVPVDDEDGGLNSLIPDWAKEQGTIGTALMGGVAMAPESVFNAAFDPYNAAWKLIDQIPGLKEILPGETEGKDSAAALLGLLAGGPMSMVDFLFEVRSQETWYGKDISDRGLEGDLMRFADTIMPLWGPVDRMISELSGGALEGSSGLFGTGLGNNPTPMQKDMSLGVALIKNLLGWNAVPLGDAAQRSVIYSMSAELDTLIEEAKRRGVDIGTQQDLRHLGIIPELPDIAEDIGVSGSRADSYILRDRLEAAGIDPMTDANYLELLERERRLGFEIITRADVENWSEQAGLDPEQTLELVEDLEGRYTSRETRGDQYAVEMGWTRPDKAGGDPHGIVDFRTKAHYNAANPDDPFLDSDGNVITLDAWRQWVEDKGVRYFEKPDADGNSYSTRSSRAADLSVSVGLVNEDGDPLSNNLTKAYYNSKNPDDVFVDREGNTITYRDVETVWPGSRLSDVRSWALSVGYQINPAATSLPMDVRRAYNDAHPNSPYFTPREWVQAGHNPLQGVYQWWVDGTVYEYWPDGMSEDNWWIADLPSTASGSSSLLDSGNKTSLSDALFGN